jgi:hypothetical protein
MALRLLLLQDISKLLYVYDHKDNQQEETMQDF